MSQRRYIKATKEGKTKILDEFSTANVYSRFYAARILSLYPGKVIGYSMVGGKKIKYVIGKKRKQKG